MQALIEFGVDIGKPIQTARCECLADTRDANFAYRSTAEFSGFQINTYWHLLFHVAEKIKVGFGPKFAYLNQAGPMTTYPGPNRHALYAYRVGGELKLQWLMRPYLWPYARIGMGHEQTALRSNPAGYAFSINSASSVGEANYFVNTYFAEALLGLQFPIYAGFSVYAQAGISGTGLKQITVLQASTSTNMSLSAGSGMLSTFGFEFSIGVAFQL